MKKVVLIDGNNLLYRSYYATAYNGNMMKNSKGFPTNALYGFTTMLNKILGEEKPEYILVALDKGKTFRHDNYSAYKAGRIEMPDELKEQFVIAKDMLDAMGIKWYEIDGYEADDIIGTFSSNIKDDYECLIISSDKDLLQLINDKVKVKLLKSGDYIMMDEEAFKKEYGLSPNKMIDIKGLQGDSSDNIPGVKGIGPKTALKLLQDFGSIENIYVNLEKVTGKVKEKLEEFKDDAFMSKQLATIYKEVPTNLSLEDIKYLGANNKLRELYENLEFYSFMKNIEKKEVKSSGFKVINNINELDIKGDIAIYLELDNLNYHTSNILGMAIYNNDIQAFIPIDVLKQNPEFLIKNNKYTYDLKKVIIALKKIGIETTNYEFDTMIAGYLLNYNVKDDIAYLANNFNYDVNFFESIYKAKSLDMNVVMEHAIRKAKFIFETKEDFKSKMIKEECLDLFNNIEMPLVCVLADMEHTGIKVDKKVLEDMQEEIKIKLELLEKDIYNMAGESFNINSYKQLGDILFDKLRVPSNKKRSTDRDNLIRFEDEFPIIKKILEYKLLSKIYGTYIIGLKDYILEDGRIHTIYNQTLARTGRLSSSEPNLQNIPTRYEYARLVRKAFIPSNDLFVSSDYSQIELRIFAHYSKVPSMMEAFKNGLDIHTKTAMDIFGVTKDEVSSDMRRQAKAVNFGILYGISGFGLSENLDINRDDAEQLLKKYLEASPGIKEYMNKLIKDAHEKGYASTIMNRKRVIEELKNKNYMIRQSGERMALNTPIQGSNADIIKKAMIDLYNKFNELGLKSKIILQIHDELVFDVLKEEKEEVKKLIKDIMENCYKLDVPLKVEVTEGSNWYEIH